jgi:drug/metabolite transporter (DMT)-like permease
VPDTGVVVAAAIGSAFLFAVSSTVKHISAQRTNRPASGSPRSIAAFAAATVTHRFWLAGIGCDVGGLALQIVALHLGSLVLVQPLLLSGLVFALLLRRATGRRHVSGRQLLWSVVLAVSLASFLALAAQDRAGNDVDRLPAVWAGVTGVVAVALCVALGRRTASRGGAAALLGTATGLIYAGTAALLKALSDIAVRHPAGIFTAWQLYLTVALGAAGLLLNQLAFQAGPLAASLPATATVDPLASIVVGVVVFDEHVRRLGGAGVVLALLLGVLTLSIVALARSAPLDDADHDHKLIGEAHRRL